MIRFWNKAWKAWGRAEFVDWMEPGDYEVRVSLFPGWKDQKHFDTMENYNIDQRGKWGWFDQVRNRIGKYIILDYNDKRNCFFTRRFVDHVRHIKNTGRRLIGGTYYTLSDGALSYIGWFGIRILCFWIRISPFTMTKIGD